MVDKLIATPALDGYRGNFQGADIYEISDLSIVSLAVSYGREKAFTTAVKKAWEIDVPEVEQTISSQAGRLIWMAPNQYLMLLSEGSPAPVKTVEEMIGSSAWMSDQSDSYCMLHCKGEMIVSALERICPLDLSISAFKIGQAKRTVMEHLGTIIIREAEDCFIIASARSSSRSFLHAIEQSILNVG